MTIQERMARPLAESIGDLSGHSGGAGTAEFAPELIASELPHRRVEATVRFHQQVRRYPGRRYYGADQFVDVAKSRETAREALPGRIRERAAHAGSQANQAAYAAVLQPGDVWA
jgi:glycine hydroxymethyltransferase